MALEASHIRFALDLKKKLAVQDIQKYISGSIYPDSRYVTKIDRELTHPFDLFVEDYGGSEDFRKGWYVHLLYDQIQKEYTKDHLPEMFEDIGEAQGQGSELWVRLTALKILQDIKDVRSFNIKEILPFLDYVENPNGEDRAKLKEYNKIFQDMYAKPEYVNIDSCYQMWKLFGIGDELSEKVKARAEEYNNNEKIIEFIENVYDGTLRKYSKLISQSTNKS